MLSTLVGVGVYTVIKNNRAAAAATEPPVVRAPPPAPAPLPAEPAPAPEPVAAPPQPVAAAEASAAPCDEVSCVLDNYAGACCAKYKPGAPRPTTNGVPESVSREELHQALDELRRPVKRCATKEDMTGIIKVRFRVLPSGDVGDVTIADVEPALAACVTRAFKKHTFPASVNGVNASFPFKITGA